MKNIRKITALIMALLLAVLFSACTRPNVESTAAESTKGTKAPKNPTTTENDGPIAEQDFEPTVTGIYVMRDGTIKTAEVTTFDNSGFDEPRYDEATLRAFVEEEISDYNKAKDSESVKLERITVQDKKATLIISYTSLNSFLEFQGNDFGVTSISIMSVGDAAKEDFPLTEMKSVEGKTVSNSFAFKYEDAALVSISGKTNVTVSGELRCISADQSIAGPSTVRVNSETPVYIIFR